MALRKRAKPLVVRVVAQVVRGPAAAAGPAVAARCLNHVHQFCVEDVFRSATTSDRPLTAAVLRGVRDGDVRCPVHARHVVIAAEDDEIRALDRDASAVKIIGPKFPKPLGERSGVGQVPLPLEGGRQYGEGYVREVGPAMTVAERLDALTVMEAFKDRDMRKGVLPDHMYWLFFSATVASRGADRPYRKWQHWKETMDDMKKLCTVRSVACVLFSRCRCLARACTACAAAGHGEEDPKQDWVGDRVLERR